MNRKQFNIVLFVCAFLIIGVGIYLGFFKNNEDELIIDGDEKNAKVLDIFVVTYDANNAKSIDSTSSSCLSENGKCSVTTPTIEPNEGYEVVGWAKDANSTSKDYDEDSEIVVRNNVTLYAITKPVDKNDIVISDKCNNSCNYDLSILNVACSQIGYIEKASNKYLDTCTKNKGNNDYNKYGNSSNAWQEAFVAWAFSKINVDLPSKGIEDVDSMNSYVDWAKNSNRWFSNKSDLHDGDLVVLDNTIGIVVYENNDWYMIVGNYNNKVDKVVFTNAVGYINMKDLSY